MATLLIQLFLVFKISFLPWCSGVACNWCVSLAIALIFALNETILNIHKSIAVNIGPKSLAIENNIHIALHLVCVMCLL